MGSFCSVDLVNMNVMVGSNHYSRILIILIFQIISSLSLLLVLSVFTPETSSAPTPGGGSLISDLFLFNPLLGLGLGVAGGAVAKGVAGLAAAGAVAGKINTLANVANAKINLINLGARLVEGGSSLLEGGK